MPADQFVVSTKVNQPNKEIPILIQTGEEVADYMHEIEGKGHALLDTSTASVKYDEYARKWKPQEFPTMTHDSHLYVIHKQLEYKIKPFFKLTIPQVIITTCTRTALKSETV
jgi:hypothetical protein